MSMLRYQSPSCSCACVVLQNVDGELADEMCHAVLPDGSEAWLQVSAGHTVGTMIDSLSSRLQHGPEFVDAVTADTNEVHLLAVLLYN